MQYKKKYEWSKRGPDEFDCAGLTWYIYHQLFEIDINLLGFGKSTTTKQMTGIAGLLNLIDKQENYDNKDKFIKSINLGDILFFHRQSLDSVSPSIDNAYPGHCGIYLGAFYFIHSSRTKGEVVISNFNKNEYWKKVLVGSKNII